MFESNSWVEADYRTALGHLEAGRVSDAELLLRAVLAMEPNHPPAWFSLGIALLRGGNLADAADCFASATALDPGNVAAWVNQGRALIWLGRPDEGIATLRHAAELAPDLMSVQETLVRACVEADRPEEALAASERAAALDPDSALIAHARGCAHRRLMQLDEAASCLRRAVELAPDSPDAWADLGTVLQAQLQAEEAMQAYRRAIELAPRNSLAALNLTQMLLNGGELAEARRLIDGLDDLKDQSPDLLRLAGEHARLEGRFADSIPLYEQALVLRPDHADSLYGLGLAQQATGRLQEAVDSFRRATILMPRHAKAWAGLGTLLLTTGQLDQGLAFLRNALALEPGHAGWRDSLAWAELDLGHPSEALAALEQTVAAYPNDLGAESRVLYCMGFQPGIEAGALAQRLKEWGTKAASASKTGALSAKSGAASAAVSDDSARPLCVAYLLPNMRSHPAQNFVVPLLAAHDRAVIEPIAYTMTSDTGALPPALAAAVDRWRFIATAPAADIAAQMQRDGIDVLVDMTAHRPGHRLDVLAARAAPIQLVWLIGTGLGTGLACVDGVIGDSRLTPPEMDKLFVETVLRPFGVYGCYRADTAAPPPGPLPARGSGSPMFGYIGRMARLNDSVVAAWAAILAALPNSRLLLDHGSLRQDGPQSHLRARFAEHGIAPERILAGFSSPVWQAWQQIDIALDPFPSSAGASVLEGLSMGVPSISLAGDLPSGRFGAAILPHVGLGDWVVDSVDSYVARAIQVAQDLDALAGLRASLRDRLAASPLCDARGFAASLEATYRHLWLERAAAP